VTNSVKGKKFRVPPRPSAYLCVFCD